MPYSEAIQIGEETLAHNQWVRLEAADLRARTNALLVTYRRHRLGRLSGASDAAGREPATSPNTPPARVLADRRLQGLTILIADDHRDTTEMFQEYFAALGATAVGAASAIEALTVVAALVIDVALIDLRMPGEDGWWFLRQLRASGTPSADAPVYAVTGWVDGKPRDPGAGFAGFFLKPVDLDVVADALALLPRRAR